MKRIWSQNLTVLPPIPLKWLTVNSTNLKLNISWYTSTPLNNKLLELSLTFRKCASYHIHPPAHPDYINIIIFCSVFFSYNDMVLSLLFYAY